MAFASGEPTSNLTGALSVNRDPDQIVGEQRSSSEPGGQFPSAFASGEPTPNLTCALSVNREPDQIVGKQRSSLRCGRSVPLGIRLGRTDPEPDRRPFCKPGTRLNCRGTALILRTGRAQLPLWQRRRRWDHFSRTHCVRRGETIPPAPGRNDHAAPGRNDHAAPGRNDPRQLCSISLPQI